MTKFTRQTPHPTTEQRGVDQRYDSSMRYDICYVQDGETIMVKGVAFADDDSPRMWLERMSVPLSQAVITPARRSK